MSSGDGMAPLAGSLSPGSRRQLAYSAVSLLAAPFLVISITSSDPVTWVIDTGELPFDTLLFIGLAEVLKVSWSLWMFPRHDTVEGPFDGECPEEDKKQSRFRLPMSRKDVSGKAVSKTGLVTKFLETLRGIGGFMCSILICHVILVLFGAPFIQDWKLTLQLSFVLVSWLFFPLCLVLRPVDILPELFYISIWDYDEHGLLSVAKWRFLASCTGAWIGAAAVPLDWDRPWQRWPIPILFSATASQLLINLVTALYFCSKLCFKNRTSKSLSKVKAI